MHRLTLLLLPASGGAFAHPGHGALEGHFHGLSPELLLLGLLVAAWAVIRSRS